MFFALKSEFGPAFSCPAFSDLTYFSRQILVLYFPFFGPVFSIFTRPRINTLTRSLSYLTPNGRRLRCINSKHWLDATCGASGCLTNLFACRSDIWILFTPHSRHAEARFCSHDFQLVTAVTHNDTNEIGHVTEHVYMHVHLQVVSMPSVDYEESLLSFCMLQKLF